MSFSPAIKDAAPPLPDFLRRDVISRKIAVEPPDLTPSVAQPPRCSAGNCETAAACRDFGECLVLLETAAGNCSRAIATKKDIDRLNEIAVLVRALTYGEMIELGEAICTANAGVEITQEALPAALHQWSMSR